VNPPEQSRELSVGVIEVMQPIGTFYTGSVDAYALLEICKFDFRRIEERGGYKEFLGFQRKLDNKRVKEIAQYITTVDAVFPTAVVIAVDDRCAILSDGALAKKLTLRSYQDPENSDFKIDYHDIASIIDGQHRLKAFEEVKNLSFQINVAVFVGVDDATKAEIFSTVNLAQTKVNTSLVYDLFGLQKKRSPEKTCHEIVIALDSLPDSPFLGRIKRLGVATDGRFGETLSQATIVKGLLPYITDDPLTDKDVGKRIGFWDPVSPKDASKRIFRHFFVSDEGEKILANVLNYFSAVRARWPVAWASTGVGNILSRTNGFNGLARFLRPAYRYFTTEPQVVSTKHFSNLLSRVQLSDQDFTPDTFLPGTSGATKLYHTLVEQSGLTPT
jgi:DGQHR domain-containing protein